MSAELIGWIVTILFIVILASGFFIGFWRGLKRSTVSLVISIVGVVVAFFITPLITNAILSIKINMEGETVALGSVIVKYITSIEEVGSLVEKNPNLETFFLNLPSALVSVVLFLLVTIAVECVLYIVYKILACTVFKVKPEDKKRRLSGGFVGLVKAFVVTIFAFMPLASLIGTANTCLSTGDYGINQTVATATAQENQTEQKDKGLLASKLPDMAVNAIEGLENNLLTKMSGLFGLDNAMFDYYGNFKIGEDKIVIREEIVNVYNVVDITNQIANIDETYSFADFDYEKITKEFNKLSSSPMFEHVLADTVGEIIMNYKDYSFIANSKIAKDYGDILDAISNGLKAYTSAGGDVSDYFTDDIKKVVKVATELGKNGTIDDVIALETMNADNIIITLTNADNYETFKQSMQKLLSLNLIRDGGEDVVKKAVELLPVDLDPIGVTTDAWTDDEWNGLANSISSIAKRYGTIAKSVKVLDVAEDATILLDEQKNYDISAILSELGLLIDEIREVNILQTSDNKPVVDKLLNTYKLTLPTEKVIANDGSEVTIENYKALFDFISPSLVKIRDEKIYSTIKSEGTTNDKIAGLAQIVSKEGNEKLLSEVVMPLYQVEPTKSLIINQITSGLNSELINLSSLSNYSEWKADLDYISSMLKALNGKKSGDDTLLSLVLNGNLDEVIDAMEENDVELIIKPLFYAKSTSGVKTKVLSSIESDMHNLTGSTMLTINATDENFIEGDDEDQTQELCNVLKKIIPFKDAFADAENVLKNVDKSVLGATLEAMQANAYRTQPEFASKSVEGIFKNAFIQLVNKFKSEYSTEVAILEANPDMLEEELGVRSLAEENYSKIDFTKLLTLIENAGV